MHAKQFLVFERQGFTIKKFSTFSHLKQEQRFMTNPPKSQLTYNLGSEIGVEEITDWAVKNFNMQRDPSGALSI